MSVRRWHSLLLCNLQLIFSSPSISIHSSPIFHTTLLSLQLKSHCVSVYVYVCVTVLLPPLMTLDMKASQLSQYSYCRCLGDKKEKSVLLFLCLFVLIRVRLCVFVCVCFYSCPCAYSMALLRYCST